MKRAYEPIAIVGYGCIFPPDSYNVEKFWNNIISNKIGIQKVSDKLWNSNLYYSEDKTAEDMTYCQLGGSIVDYQFQNNVFSGEVVEKLNKTQLMLLDTVLQAFKEGCLEWKEFQNNRTGMVIGNMLGDSSFANYCLLNRTKEIIDILKKSEEFTKLKEQEKAEIISSLEKNMQKEFIHPKQAGKNQMFTSNLCKGVAEILHIQGPRMIVDGACSGSGLAIDEAIKNIHAGKADAVIVAGVLGNMIVTGNVAFAKIGGLSSEGSFPLDQKASGLVPSEGVGTIILKPLSKAVKESNIIYGVIRGSGVASDGKGKSIYAPSIVGQYKAMKKSIDKSGMDVENIQYIETHATGTKIGDVVELESIEKLFEGVTLPPHSVALSSIKSQIGHSFSAAGMANLIKILQGFRYDSLPPTHNVENFTKKSMLEGKGFFVNNKLTYWKKKENQPRCACLNAFGFGGINANVIVQEYEEDYHKNLMKEYSDQQQEDIKKEIAIVGIGCINGFSRNYEEWKNAEKEKKDYITTYNSKRFKPNFEGVYNQEGDFKASIIEELNFPFIRFKIPPKILKEIDKSQLLGLMGSYDVVSSYGAEKIAGDRTSVYIGSMMGLESAIETDYRIRHREYLKIIKETEAFKKQDETVREKIEQEIISAVREYIPKTEEDTLPGYMDNIIAGRIANFFNINGANAVIDADSVSFAQALQQGVINLQEGESDQVIVGGIHSNMSPEFNSLPKKLHMDQTVIPAEGAAFFILKRVEDVTPDEHIYAKISSINYSSDDACVLAKEYKKKKVFIITDQSLETKDENHYFYYGAQSAFQLLEACRKIEEKKEDYVAVYTKSLLGGSYTIELQGREAANLKEAEKEEAVEDKRKSVQTFYAAADSLKELETRLKNRIQVKKEELNVLQYKIAIVYKDEEELERKINQVLKMNV